MNEKYYYIAIFIICLAVHLSMALKNCNEPLMDAHHFRQSQTALSTYYTIKEGFKLDYITPVLGAPWSIPMEFPLYQWIAAGIVLIFKTPIEQTGRFVSLLFFYLSLFPIYSILGFTVPNKNHRLLMLCFLLISPTYIFWSRTFMIESLALFLSLSFLWGFINGLEKGKGIANKYNVIGIFSVILASLVKITTLSVYLYAALIFYLWFWYKKDKTIRFSKSVIMKFLLFGIIFNLVIVLTSYLWISYADTVKLLNPLASDFLTSFSQAEWYNESFLSKFSLEYWSQIFFFTLLIPKFLGSFTFGGFTLPNIMLFMIFVSIVVFHLIFYKNRRIEIILSISAFIIAPLTFTKLHYIHAYYNYPNMIFLYLAAGYFIVSIIEKNNLKLQIIGKYILLPIVLGLLFLSYYLSYYSIQSKSYHYPDVVEKVKQSTKDKDVILIYGLDWDPTITFGIKRKSIMDRLNLPLSNEKIQKSIELTGKNLIGGMLLYGKYDSNFIRERVDYFGFTSKPIYQDSNCMFFIKP
jgi:hypothetical protein